MTQRVTADDFFTGLFAALAIKGMNTISIRKDRLDKALLPVFERMRKDAASNDLDLRFRVRLHPVHGDSITVRNGIYNAAQRDLISLDNPEFQDIRLKLTSTDAEARLDDLAGGRQLYLELAELLLDQYQEVEAS